MRSFVLTLFSWVCVISFVLMGEEREALARFMYANVHVHVLHSFWSNSFQQINIFYKPKLQLFNYVYNRHIAHGTQIDMLLMIWMMTFDTVYKMNCELPIGLRKSRLKMIKKEQHSHINEMREMKLDLVLIFFVYFQIHFHCYLFCSFACLFLFVYNFFVLHWSVQELDFILL